METAELVQFEESGAGLEYVLRETRGKALPVLITNPVRFPRLSAERLAKVEEYCDRIAGLVPTAPKFVLDTVANTYAKAGRFDEAIACLKESKEIGDSSRQIAKELARSGRYDKVREFLEDPFFAAGDEYKVSWFRNEKSRVYREAAIMAASRGDYDAAKALVERVDEYYRERVVGRVVEQAIKRDDFEIAEQLSAKAGNERSFDWTRAVWHAKRGEYSQAESYAQKVDAKSELSSTIYWKLAKIALGREDDAQGEVWLAKGKEKWPPGYSNSLGDAASASLMAFALKAAKKGDFAQAEGFAERAVDIPLGSRFGFSVVGAEAARQGKYELSERLMKRDYEKKWGVDEYHRDSAHEKVISGAAEGGNFAQADKWFGELELSDYKKRDASWQLGRIAMKKREYDLAFTYMSRTKNEAYWICTYVAREAAENGDYEKAIEFHRKSEELRPPQFQQEQSMNSERWSFASSLFKGGLVQEAQKKAQELPAEYQVYAYCTGFIDTLLGRKPLIEEYDEYRAW